MQSTDTPFVNNYIIWPVILLVLGVIIFFERAKRTKRLKKERAAAHQREAALRSEAAELRSRAAASEALLQNLQRRLVQTEKMASLGQLTAGIAHEIKNPLNFVVNFATLSQNLISEVKEVLSEKPGYLDAEWREEVDEVLGMLSLNAERINEHGRRADNIVRSMLKHSRPSEQALVDTALPEILNQSIDLAFNGHKYAGADLEIDIARDIDPEIGKVKLMPQNFSRVIINILDNAFHAVQEAASIRNGSYIPRIVLKAVREEDSVLITIEDNGRGMTEAVRAKVFDPFFTTKPTGAGNTGLGLSLSYDIIAQGHNGMLSVESEPGAGAKFIIQLPAIQEDC